MKWVLQQHHFPVDVRDSDQSGIYILFAQMQQTETSDPELARLLLGAGASSRFKGESGHCWSVLHKAVERHILPRYIFPYDFDPSIESCQGCSLLFSSPVYGGGLLGDLNELCHKLNRRAYWTVGFRSGHRTPLSKCPRMKKWEANWRIYVQMMLQSGCSVHTPAPNGWTPLDVLCRVSWRA